MEKGRPPDGQVGGIQMDACVECLHVANSHLPVRLELWEMLDPLDTVGKKEERMRRRREENELTKSVRQEKTREENI